MTAHEVFTSLFWLVVVGYIIFIGWFAWSWMRRDTARRARERHPTTRS